MVAIDVIVPTFINPSLFWVVEYGNKERNKILKNIDQKLEELRSLYPASHNAVEIGEMVGIVRDNTFCRATIEEVVHADINSKHRYICWLIDYGTMHDADLVFKLSPEIKKIPPQAKQAALNNVCYIKKELEVKVLEGVIKNYRTILPTAGAVNISLQLLSQSHNLKFQIVGKENGILYGDILMQISEEKKTLSLSQTLVEKEVAVIDEQMFETIKNNMKAYKETHISLIHSICEKQNCFGRPNKNHASVINSTKKAYKDLEELDLQNLEPLRNGRRKINLNTSSGSEKTGSDVEHADAKESSESENNLIKIRKKLLLERERNKLSAGSSEEITASIIDLSEKRKQMLLQRAKKSVSPQKSNKENLPSGSPDKTPAIQKTNADTLENGSGLRLLEDTADNKEYEVSSSDDKPAKNDNVTSEVKQNAPKNAIFMPAGQSFTIKHPVKKQSDSSSPSMEKALNKRISKVHKAFNKKVKQDETESSSTERSGLDDTSDNKEHDLSSDVKTECKPADEPYVRNEMEAKKEVKRLIPKNAIFMPAGQTFTGMNKSSKNAKKSSSSSSENTTNKRTPNVQRAANKKPKHDENSSTESECPTNKVDTTFVDEKISTETPDTDAFTPHSFITPHNANRIKTTNCTCKQCKFWTEEDDWETPPNFDEPQQICKAPVIRPALLLKEDKEPSETEILFLDFGSMTKMQKLTVPKLLIHGESIPSPVNLVSEINVISDIHLSLDKLGYKKPKRIQVYTWPALTRNQHVFMIADQDSGKTIAYLPILCSFVLEKGERYRQLFKMGGGPIVVILCSSSKKCEDVYVLITRLLGRGSGAKVSVITYPSDHVNVSHVDILVTMPTVLSSLLLSRAVNFKRLCHFVLEDGDTIIKNYSELLTKFLNLAQDMLKNRYCPKSVQLIVCARHYTAGVESLLKKLDKIPFVCIGNHIEAAGYGKMNFVMKILGSSCKEQELKSLLQETYKFTRSIVLCREDEIKEVEEMLMLKGITYTAITEDMCKEDIYYLEQTWSDAKGGNYSVLICSDFILSAMLSVTCASFLIHYSLPSSWTTFVKRFRCLLENCHSPLDTKKNKVRCRSVVFIDEESGQALPKFQSFMSNGHFKNIPEKLKECFRKIQIQEEQEKANNKIEICDNLKLLGKCNTTGCTSRHALNKNLDSPHDLLKNGIIKFKIIEVTDVTSYTIKILEHIDPDGNVTKFEDTTQKISEELSGIAEILKKPCSTPVVGHLYTYFDNDCFYRCKLIKMFELSVHIKLLDNGTVVQTLKSKLFKLPDEYKQLPPTSYEVYLANFIPPHHDETFSYKSKQITTDLFEKIDVKNMNIRANINLQLGNILWLKNVEEQREMFDKTMPTTGFQLCKELLKKKVVEKNDIQLIKLYELCAEADINLPVYEVVKPRVIKVEAQAKPQWAFLDIENVNEVIFSSAISANEIYVKLRKFNQELIGLQKEIQEVIRKPFYPVPQSITVGQCYLAKDPCGDEYSRVIVRNVEEERALCFFVDYGDEIVIDVSEIKHINNTYIKKLPFQTIQCRLHGIKAVDDEDVTNTLYEYSMEPDTDIFRLLCVKPCLKEDNVIIPGQKRYSVLLKDSFGQRKMLINTLLIDCGMAIPNEETIEDFELPEMEMEVDEDEEIEVLDVRKTVDEYTGVQVVPEFPKFFHVENFEGMEDMEINLLDPIGFYNELCKNEVVNKPENNDVGAEASSSKRNCDLPAIKAAPAVDYFTPEVMWSQTNELVKLKIMVVDVVDYKCIVSKGRMFTFSTTKNETQYKVNLMLYERVSSSFKHASIGPHVKVTLNKSKTDVEWPRLIVAKERVRKIKYDTTAIQIPETKERKFLELPIEDDADKSDGEIDMMYHNCSDLDSDYDCDIPFDDQ